MTMQHLGLLGAVTEAADIARECECSAENAFEIQSWLAEWRAQEYRDTFESNVVYGVPFGQRREK
jgi:hypothetical protein